MRWVAESNRYITNATKCQYKQTLIPMKACKISGKRKWIGQENCYDSYLKTDDIMCMYMYLSISNAISN